MRSKYAVTVETSKTATATGHGAGSELGLEAAEKTIQMAVEDAPPARQEPGSEQERHVARIRREQFGVGLELSGPAAQLCQVQNARMGRALAKLAQELYSQVGCRCTCVACSRTWACRCEREAIAARGACWSGDHHAWGLCCCAAGILTTESSNCCCWYQIMLPCTVSVASVGIAVAVAAAVSMLAAVAAALPALAWLHPCLPSHQS